MNLKSFSIFVRERGDLFVFTTVFGPGATIARVNPERYETIEPLERNLAALVQSRLAASQKKSDISGDELEMPDFLKSSKAKSRNVFDRECTTVNVSYGPRGYHICVGHWDGRGFDSSREDLTELSPQSSIEEVAKRLAHILHQIIEKD